MITEIGLCQNKVRYLGFLWYVKCGTVLHFRGRERMCLSCGWVRPPLLPLLSAVAVPPRSWK